MLEECNESNREVANDPKESSSSTIVNMAENSVNTLYDHDAANTNQDDLHANETVNSDVSK